MAAYLNVDTEGVRDAATTAADAPSAAPTPAVTVTPCAADAVSVQMATRLTGAAGELNADTIAVHARTTGAGQHLAASAESYDAQEGSASRALGQTGPGAAPAIAVAAMKVPPPPAITAPTGLPAGAEPVTGHQASMLIHGGPGAAGFDTAADQLDTHAAALEQSATQVRSARGHSESSWSSRGAEAAHSHLHRLEADYTSQAEAARRLSSQFRGHAEDYRRARSAMPTPQVFDELTQRLRMAVAANSTPPTVGMYGPAITALQSQLAQANHTALAAYQQYRGAALAPALTGAPGDGNAGTQGALNPGISSDGDSDSSGDGLGESVIDGQDAAAAGTETLASGIDPAAAGMAAEPGSELAGTVVPALLGGVTGVVGGLVGGLAAAGQGLQQAGTQLVGGLTQAAGAATAGANTADLPGDFGAMAPGGADFGGGLGGGGGGDFGDVGDFGGGDYGGTSPASTAGGAPGTFPAAASPTAAPATFSAGAMPASAGTHGAGGHGMMPPMMPMGMAGGAPGGGDADRRLYPERRLRVESPANAEPVKGRREARKTRNKGSEDTGETP